MASSWGVSWGVSWGDAWGTIAVATTDRTADAGYDGRKQRTIFLDEKPKYVPPVYVEEPKKKAPPPDPFGDFLKSLLIPQGRVAYPEVQAAPVDLSGFPDALHPGKALARQRQIQVARDRDDQEAMQVLSSQDQEGTEDLVRRIYEVVEVMQNMPASVTQPRIRPEPQPPKEPEVSPSDLIQGVAGMLNLIARAQASPRRAVYDENDQVVGVEIVQPDKGLH